MKQFTRRAYGTTVGSYVVASISVEEGTYEITAASVRMGGPSPSLNGNVAAQGFISFRKTDGSGNVEAETYLAAGQCTMWWPLIMQSPHRVRGPGQIYTSLLDLGGSGESTFDVSFRRLPA